MGVAVMGIGISGFFPTSDGLSYREMIARAAAMAYEDAGIAPEEVDGAVSTEEDFISGYSIADEYVPDQIGMVRKPVYTICGDFLHGICSAAMQIRTGQFKTVVVESYSKASNVLEKDEVLHFAFDPIFDRLGVSPHYLAGIEMQQYLASGGATEEEIAAFAAVSRTKGISNPLAPYGARVTAEDVLSARPIAAPLTELMAARHSDGAVVVVLGLEEIAEERSKKPVLLAGTGWGSGSSITQRRDHSDSAGTVIAAGMAYSEAGVESPAMDADVYYLSDLYAHRGLMHLDALGLPREILPDVNPDGGCLAGGDVIEANGGARFVDAVRQLRGEAGAHQVKGASCALVHSWRGLPTDSCAVVILENDGRTA